MSTKCRGIVIDDHPIARVGVRALFDRKIEIAEAPDPSTALDLIRSAGGFDFAIVDVGTRSSGRSGLGGVVVLLEAAPDLPVVVFSESSERHLVNEAVEVGARAFVLKSSPVQRLAQAVDAALEAQAFIDPALSMAASGGRSPGVTKRQREILQLLADGFSTAGAAAELGLSPETVKTHTKHILAKLNARDRAHAVAIALRSSIID